MDPYQELGHLVSEQCSPGFSRAVLEAEIDDDWAEMRVICVMPNGNSSEPEVPAAASVEMHDNLDQIWQQMEAQTGHRWKTCVFTVEAGGGFKLDVAY